MPPSARHPIGRLIALEGIDGSGKTTQAGRLAERVRQTGRLVLQTAEPSRGPIGQLIRQAIATTAPQRVADAATLALLFAADRRQHLLTTVEPALARGEWVITDRYLLSSLAYQSRGLDLAWVAALNHLARPADLTIYLDLPVAASLARLAGRAGPADIFESPDRLRQIAEQYLAGRAYLAGLGWRIQTVAADGPVEAVAERVWAALAAEWS